MSQPRDLPSGLTDALAQHVSAYGRPLFLYRGTGRLITEGGTAYACAFAAAQLEDGTVLLLCGAVTAMSAPGGIPYFLPPQRFEGTSDDGARLVLRGNIVQHNYLVELPPDQGPFGFAYVGTPSSSTSRSARRGVRTTRRAPALRGPSPAAAE